MACVRSIASVGGPSTLPAQNCCHQSALLCHVCCVMMATSKTAANMEPDDAQLVAQSLAGDREAFAGIVARYQSLVCSLAYSATGNFSRSEDLAQETFL